MDPIDCKELAKILGYAHTSMAQWLCRSGKLVSARKMGNAWVADRGEVRAYKLLQYGSRRGRGIRKKE